MNTHAQILRLAALPAGVGVFVFQLGDTPMSLAGWEQVLADDLLDRQTGALLGQPIGVVNVHSPRCTLGDGHLHVLFTTPDGLLRKSLVHQARPRPPDNDAGDALWAANYQQLLALPQLFIAI
jgi:hypothetical protein